MSTAAVICEVAAATDPRFGREGCEIYLEGILRQAVPVLSLLDREPESPTSGCFDRTFWAWKFSDFPGARFQEGLCFLSFLHATPLPGSDYQGNEALLRWIAGGFDFWCGIQRNGGDFDEAYPLERSLAATAFTSFYLSEAWELVGQALPRETRTRFVRSLERAGDWLIRNDETHGFLSNHLAAASAALFHAHRITGEARFESRGRTFLERILGHQSREGWYDEYGGADPGYQTHGSFYLERILELTGDSDLQRSLNDSYRFMAEFIHPDRSLGGEYTSRNTQTYYPAAFEMAASRSGAASWIAEQMRPAVRSLSAAGLGTVDAYNLFPLLNNNVFALRASLAGKELASPEPPDRSDGVRHFPAAGIAIVRRSHYDLYISVIKGGVVKAFDRRNGQLALSDCGYVGALRGGGTLSSQWVDADRNVRIHDDHIEIEGDFYQVSRPVMSPWRFVAFRLFSLVLGRVPGFSAFLKSVLVRVLIYRKRVLPLSFVRRIRFGEDFVEIEDELCGDAAGKVETLRQADAFTTIHMGSSRYFVPGELSQSRAPLSQDEAQVDVVELANGIHRKRRVAIG